MGSTIIDVAKKCGYSKTTVSRAKEVAPLAEKMITLAKKNDLAAYRQAVSFITKEDVAGQRE